MLGKFGSYFHSERFNKANKSIYQTMETFGPRDKRIKEQGIKGDMDNKKLRALITELSSRQIRMTVAKYGTQLENMVSIMKMFSESIDVVDMASRGKMAEIEHEA